MYNQKFGNPCLTMSKQGSIYADSALADRHYVLCLWAFGALGDGHSDFLTFTQGPATFRLDGRVMNKHVLATSLFNKTKSFFVIKPFDGAFNLLCHINLV